MNVWEKFFIFIVSVIAGMLFLAIIEEAKYHADRKKRQKEMEDRNEF